MPPIKIAFILDGQVVDILNTDERLASIFLSEPVIIDVTAGVENALIGAHYDSSTGTFSFPPAPEDEPSN
jgi:hypothetical protein